ncbi:unnamed protein product [Caenorhabditis auriculariae]|uniref:Uncharacterized protein n=1 Tax=Caenorhabditis auriculariae TaxID=2777116 RepID=A0A8S1HI55_9PELO|nr:unnamed protein product [Caenorhabditis auriculariae]
MSRSLILLPAIFTRRSIPLFASSPFKQYRSIQKEIPIQRISIRFYCQNSKDERAKNAKIRRAYVLGGCLFFIWISTHAILLYRRRTEHRALNETLPPISWEEFERNFMQTGEVKTIIFQPHFEIANVYLHSAKEQLMKKTVLNWIHAAPDKFSRPPDVRFFFEGSAKEMETAVSASVQKNGKEVDFEIDQFPSYRELSFIMVSSLFAMAAVSLVK